MKQQPRRLDRAGREHQRFAALAMIGAVLAVDDARDAPGPVALDRVHHGLRADLSTVRDRDRVEPLGHRETDPPRAGAGDDDLQDGLRHEGTPGGELNRMIAQLF